MNLLIVDDEMFAIQGILDDVPWEQLKFDNIYTANSYAQAVNIFRSHKVDILLCDIEMPMGNGLDLVQWVRGHTAVWNVFSSPATRISTLQGGPSACPVPVIF